MIDVAPTASPYVLAERDALITVAGCARAQIDALRTGRVEAFEAAAAQTLDAVGELDRAQGDRRRHLAPAEAAAARDALAEAALDARQACDDLACALDHAVALGREMLGAWQQLSVPATAHVYTAHGRVGPPDRASHLTQTG